MFWGLVKLLFWLITLPIRIVLRLTKIVLFLLLPLILMRLLKTVMWTGVEALKTRAMR